MKNPPKGVPALYVEGPDDISAIAALLRRHGYDTQRGKKHLFIAHAGDEASESTGGDAELMAIMPDRIKVNPPQPCGFVFDIDTEADKRWRKVKAKLESIVSTSIEFNGLLPDKCESDGTLGYIGRVKNYTSPFGVWLMPDCSTDGQKLEHLVESLIPNDDPILAHARTCTASVPSLTARFCDATSKNMKCFAEKDRIKAEIRAWLAWQEEPGQPFGAAITRKYLAHNSSQAVAFLGWLTRLYGFTFPGPDPAS